MRDYTDESDDVIGALADPLRRRTVSVLADRDAPVSVTELAAAVRQPGTDGESADETATDGGRSPGERAPSEDGSDPEQRVATALYHVHLPKLDDAGLVSFDPESKAVSDRRSGELVDAL